MKKNKWILYGVLIILSINALRVAHKIYNKRQPSKKASLKDSARLHQTEF